MHHLHILIAATLTLPLAGNKTVDSPVLSLPIADPIGTALEMGLELIPDRAADGNPEIIAKGKVPGVKIAHIFGRDVTTPEMAGEVDTEIWVTSDDDAVIASADEQIRALAADPANPATDPANPATDPANPATDPANPATDPANPATDPANPATDPANPATDPANPATDPANPATDPANPTADPAPETPTADPANPTA